MPPNDPKDDPEMELARVCGCSRYLEYVRKKQEAEKIRAQLKELESKKDKDKEIIKEAVDILKDM